MPSPQHCCQTCGADNLHEIAGFEHLPRVTSDSKPCPQGGRLFVCERCEVLARRLLESGVLPRSGTLLDVGAGSGAMLGAFSDDEDPAREGRLHLGRPILRPEQVPPGEVWCISRSYVKCRPQSAGGFAGKLRRAARTSGVS